MRQGPILLFTRLISSGFVRPISRFPESIKGIVRKKRKERSFIFSTTGLMYEYTIHTILIVSTTGIQKNEVGRDDLRKGCVERDR